MLAQTIGIVVVLLLVLAAGLALTIRYVWGSVFGHTNSPIGAACSEDKNCANGTCAHYGKGGPLQCCPVANGSELYGGYDYCTSLPDGTPCWSDAMCTSGLCDDTDTCAPVQAAGSACSSDPQCAGGACARPTYPGADGDYVCCPNGSELCDGDLYCIGSMPDGGACGDNCNDLCQSGNCISGICEPASVPVGQACQEDSQCPSGSYCARPSYPGADDSYVCCQGKSELCGGDLYCVGAVPDGGACGDNCNDLCQSGNCASDVCQPSGLPGLQACEEDSDCASGECGRTSYCSDESPPGCTEPTYCCPNGWELADGREYCNGVIPDGGFCRRDAMCQSGYCYDGGCSTESNAVSARAWGASWSPNWEPTW